MRTIKFGDTKGIKRKFDELGRIVIPKEYRRELKIKETAKGEMFLLPDGIFIKVN